MRIKSLLAVLLLLSTPALAADIDGTWTGTVDSPTGPVEVKYTFKVEMDMLTGSAIGPDGTALPITKGTIDGNKVSFSMSLDFGTGPVTFDYKGELTKDEATRKDKLSLQTSFMDTPISMVLTKS